MSLKTISGRSVEEIEELLKKKEKVLKISEFLKDFYTEAINIIETTSYSMYAHPFNSNDPFIIENLPEILEEIKQIFPDCSIKPFIGGRHGEMAIVTESLTYLGQKEIEVIDWY
jgi:hypothetical protein